MGQPLAGPDDLKRIYERRFDEHIAYRDRVWKVLTAGFFSRFVRPSDTVLDLGCGYGEFINNIGCREKLAMDMNPAAGSRLAAGVRFLEQDCSAPWPLDSESLDAVFTSNFLEHLPNKQALGAALSEAFRCLRPGGCIIAMGPNVRYVGGAYWDFWDHHLALTDLSMREALETRGFQIEMSRDRFLPYTMVNRRRAPMFLVSLYLNLPLAWKLLGKQFLVVGRK